MSPELFDHGCDRSVHNDQSDGDHRTRGQRLRAPRGRCRAAWLRPSPPSPSPFALSLDGTVPAENANKPLLAIEAYLQQIDSASGTGTVLDDTYASDLHVTH